MKQFELYALVHFVGMPDEWSYADGPHDKPRILQWDEQAKAKLADFQVKISELKGRDLDYVETEAREVLQRPPLENRQYLFVNRHRKMYLRHLLGLVQTEVQRRADALGPTPAQGTVAESTPRPKSGQQKPARGQSLFTRAVRNVLIKRPEANGQEICRGIDDDGVPKEDNTTFEEDYQGDFQKRKDLDSRFSKIRKKMKKEGLLRR